MNKYVISLVLLASVFCAKGYSADLTVGQISYAGSYPNSEYAITHATVAVTSTTASAFTIPSASGYRKVWFQFEPTFAQMAAGTSVFFSLNGSTTGIYSSGYVLRFSTNSTSIQPQVYEASFETNAPVKALVAPGQTNVIGRSHQYRRNF